ncbi:MAG TPA: TetR/AcrR family transcriptional regulator [Solirubrobacteraceae bacterium]|nr:TetR/AcrR family transcriptional regulator [Solirubrobacteraceae bacterium]
MKSGSTSTGLTRAEKQARTRAALLDAGARVFVTHGFQGASVELIASEAGYTRGAFYSNFSSKEELFAELLQERVYSIYRQMAETSAGPERPTLRQVGEQLAAIQGDPDGRWLFRLWLELLAHAGRDGHFRQIAAGFWSANRALSATAIDSAYASVGRQPPVSAHHVASAMIALDIGLALQHFVDPDAVPLDLYPELYELLFGPHDPH